MCVHFPSFFSFLFYRLTNWIQIMSLWVLLQIPISICNKKENKKTTTIHNQILVIAVAVVVVYVKVYTYV